MKPNRTDIYARIHKGLRKALFEFSEAAGKVNSENTPEMLCAKSANLKM